MAVITVLHEETGLTSNITIDVLGANFSDNLDLSKSEAYLRVNTNIRKFDNTTFPTYFVKDGSDTAPGYPSTNNFTELVNGYIEYFVDTAGLGQSSSSSSSSTSSSSSSSTSSSSSSSEGYSTSSSSSSSTSQSSSSSSSSTSESSSSSSSSTSESSSSSSSSTSESSSSSSSSQ